MVCTGIAATGCNVVVGLAKGEGGSTCRPGSSCFGFKKPMFNEDNECVLNFTVQKD